MGREHCCVLLGLRDLLVYPARRSIVAFWSSVYALHRWGSAEGLCRLRDQPSALPPGLVPAKSRASMTVRGEPEPFQRVHRRVDDDEEGPPVLLGFRLGGRACD